MSTPWRSPSSSRYWNSCWPGRSWHGLTMRAMRRSPTWRFQILPLLPLNSKRMLAAIDLRHAGPAQRGQAEALVVACAYVALPTRIRVLSSSRTTVASTFSRGRPRWPISAAMRSRMRGQRLAEVEHAFVLRAVAHLAPARMVAVLLAAPVVAAGRLDVAVGVGADPDIGPGRRDRQRFGCGRASPCPSRGCRRG